MACDSTLDGKLTPKKMEIFNKLTKGKMHKDDDDGLMYSAEEIAGAAEVCERQDRDAGVDCLSAIPWHSAEVSMMDIRNDTQLFSPC